MEEIGQRTELRTKPWGMPTLKTEAKKNAEKYIRSCQGKETCSKLRVLHRERSTRPKADEY